MVLKPSTVWWMYAHNRRAAGDKRQFREEFEKATRALSCIGSMHCLVGAELPASAPSGCTEAPRMDEVEGLFPVPLLRARRLLDMSLVTALCQQIRDAHTRKNARSGLLSHTEIVGPDANELYRQVTRAVGPKLVEFGALLFGDRLGWAIKEMWTNVLEAGGSQSMHAHANSFVSGIIYLSPSHPSAHTVFVRNPRFR